MLAWIARMKKSTIGIASFFLFNIGATQIETTRDLVVKYVFPMLIHHPRWGGIITSAFGLALLLHRPGAQKRLHDLLGKKPDVPAEPGETMGRAEVIVEPQGKETGGK
jgi:hypothetical protein